MFVLADMKDTVRISPWNFHLKLEDAVIEALNKKFANKVWVIFFIAQKCLWPLCILRIKSVVFLLF